MGKIATEQEAYDIGKQGTPNGNKCCTKSRAEVLGCMINGSYSNNQLVQLEHLSPQPQGYKVRMRLSITDTTQGRLQTGIYIPSVTLLFADGTGSGQFNTNDINNTFARTNGIYKYSDYGNVSDLLIESYSGFTGGLVVSAQISITKPEGYANSLIINHNNDTIDLTMGSIMTASGILTFSQGFYIESDEQEFGLGVTIS